MRVICTAVVEDDRLKANLCECVGILGGKPNISGNTVCIEYEGSDSTAEKFVELFSQYPVHGISMIS